MRVLAFDSASAVGSVAVVEDGATRFCEAFEAPRGRGGALFPLLDAAVRCGRPDRVVAGTGPGSYNGLRSAIAAAFGIAKAAGAELVGVPSILALDGVEDYIAVGDARGGSIYFARVVRRGFASPPELVPVEEAAGRVARLGGVPVLAPALIAGLPMAVEAHANAVVLARLGAAIEGPFERPKPIYLKPPHITKASKAGRVGMFRRTPPGD